MSEKGMIFTGESIRAMLEGRKTVTRRRGGLDKINEMPDLWHDPFFDEVTGYWNFWQRYTGDVLSAKPRYAIGDIVYAKETWALAIPLGASIHADRILHYKADGIGLPKWKSAMFMFKKYARIWREIVGARPERLQEITPDDAVAEGCGSLHSNPMLSAIDNFSQLWGSTNPKHPWDRNEWVWRYEFKS